MDQLLQRPILSAATQRYWDAFVYLERDREDYSHSFGMAGGVIFVRRIKRSTIRAEGRRRGYRSEALDRFVEFVAAFDDLRVRLVNVGAMEDFKAAVNRSTKPRR